MALTIQRQWNAAVAYKLQSALGTLATGAGASLLPLTGGTGNVTQQSINSVLVRQDGMSIRGRGGTFVTSGQYPSEFQSGNFDDILQAIMRGTWAGGGSLGGHILTNPAAGALVRRYFTIEEQEFDLLQSQVYQDCIWTRFDLSAQPNQMFTFTPYWMGTGQAFAYGTGGTGAYPNFSSTAYPNTNFIPLAAIDLTITIGTGPLPGSGLTVQADLTSFALQVDLGATAPPVAGSKFSPDVFDGVMKISMPGLTVMESDLVKFNNFIAETPLIIKVLAAEPAPGTAQYQFTLPNFTLGQAQKSDMRRDGGPLTRNIQVPDARVGIDLSGGGNAATMLIIERST